MRERRAVHPEVLDAIADVERSRRNRGPNLEILAQQREELLREGGNLDAPRAEPYGIRRQENHGAQRGDGEIADDFHKSRVTGIEQDVHERHEAEERERRYDGVQHAGE